MALLKRIRKEKNEKEKKMKKREKKEKEKSILREKMNNWKKEKKLAISSGHSSMRSTEICATFWGKKNIKWKNDKKRKSCKFYGKVIHEITRDLHKTKTATTTMLLKRLRIKRKKEKKGKKEKKKTKFEGRINGWMDGRPNRVCVCACVCFAIHRHCGSANRLHNG